MSRAAEIVSRNAGHESSTTEIDIHNAEIESSKAEIESSDAEIDSEGVGIESSDAEIESRASGCSTGELLPIIENKMSEMTPQLERPKRYVPRGDVQFAGWAAYFAANVQLKASELGIPAARAQELVDLVTSFRATDREYEALKARAKGMKLMKNQIRAKAEELAREIAQEIRANSAVPESELITLTLSKRNTRKSRVRISTPTDLVAKANALGYVDLKWDGGGNRPGAVYIIESRRGNSGRFSYVGTSTATRYRVKNQTPGEQRQYRVHAERRGERSGSTNVAMVYAPDAQTPALLQQMAA